MLEGWNVGRCARSRSHFPSFQHSNFLLRIPPELKIRATSFSPPTRCITAFGRWARSGVPSSCPDGARRVTGRQVTGATFVAWRRDGDDDAQAQAGSELPQGDSLADLGLKRQEVQDWLVLWIFNHRSRPEAYVSGAPARFPPDLKVRAFPNASGSPSRCPASPRREHRGRSRVRFRHRRLTVARALFERLPTSRSSISATPRASLRPKSPDTCGATAPRSSHLSVAAR